MTAQSRLRLLKTRFIFTFQDYSVPLQRTLLDICKVVTFAQSEGKVAIHCHAGLGRTGVVIACFLVYHHKMKPKDVSCQILIFINFHVFLDCRLVVGRIMFSWGLLGGQYDMPVMNFVQ